MKLRPVLTVAAVGSLIAVGNTVPAYADDNQNVDDVNQVGVDNLAQSLVGENIEVTDYTYTGSNEAAGMFSGFGDSIGIDSGVLLSTGYADHPEGYGEAVLYGPNESGSTGGYMDAAGDADLEALVGETTYDAAVLEINFIPEGDTVEFNYVFGSEEYPEFVDSGYNDVFAFFVNGTNQATIEGEDGETFVSIDNINANKNSSFFRDNDYVPGEESPIYTGLDGLTTVLGFEADVTAGEENTLKLAIADVGDSAYDSAVMIQAGTFSSPVNVPPVAEDQSLETGVDEPLDIALVATDEDEDELSYTVNDEGLNGTLEGDGANWTFTPEEGFEGSTSFTFIANDGEEDSNTATVTIQVGEAQNTPPVADDQDIETDFNTPADITLTGSDADEDDLTFEVVDTDDLAGELEVDGANVTFTPEEGFSGTTSFTYVANDGEADSEPATVTITVAEEVVEPTPTETPEPTETPSVEPTETPTTEAPTETADPSKTAEPVEDEDTVEEASDEKLSDTGSSAAILAIGGVLLVAAGAALLYMRRRAAN